MIACPRVETFGRCLPRESGKICTLFCSLGKLSADTFGMLRSYDDVQDALDVLYR